MTLLLDATVKVSLLVLAGLVSSTLLRRQSAAVRHWVLATALLCGLSVPVLALVLPAWHVSIPWSTPAASSSLRWISEPEPLDAPRGAAEAVSASSNGRDLSGYARAAMVGWVGGVAIGLVGLAAGLLRIRRLASRSEVVRSGHWRQVADEVSHECGLRQPVRLLQCAHPTMLVTWGTLRPSILLPGGAAQWSEDRMRVVLHHELAHVRRLDWIVTLAAAVLRCIYWFNPLLWIACRQLRHEGERACDDMVLGAGVSGADYATHLLAVARESATHRQPWSPAIAIAHRSTLEGRVRAMLNARVNRQPLTGLLRAATLALVLATTLPLAVASLSSDSTTAKAATDITLVSSGTIPVLPASAAEPVPSAPRAAGSAGAAQTVGGAIEGTLYDQFGGRLPGATVRLSNVATGNPTTEVATDRTGAFAFRDLPAGDYELDTSLIGFTRVKNLIRAAPGVTARRYITLPIGTVNETIHVTCETSVLSTSRPTAPAGSATPGVPARPAPRPTPQGAEPQRAAMFTGGIGGQIKAPTKTAHTNPVCPAGVQPTSAVVLLAGRIGIDGLFTDLRDVSTQSQPAYAASAMEAARQWTFTPTLLNGAPIEADIRVTVSYSWY